MPAIPPEAPPADALSEPPEFPSPRIVASRRLMGPNVYSDSEGALLEVQLESHDDAWLTRLCQAWENGVYALADWAGDVREFSVRRSASAESSMATLFFTAPVDVLMTAAEVSEQAWLLAEATVAGSQSEPVDDALFARIGAAVATEIAAHPHLEFVQRAALSKECTFTFDDEFASVGSGYGSLTWALLRLPHPTDIDWSTVHEVPIALVTGSNGKTTTTRLVAAMFRATGRAAGLCCSDGVWVDDDQVEAGDFSGPSGARAVLRDTRVQAAVLETARGGILRRGLAVHRATGAIITNIAADHFGEYGVHTLGDLAEAKFVVARTLTGRGRLVLNADDDTIVSYASSLQQPLAWFSAAETNSLVDAHVLAGGDAAIVVDGRVMLHLGDTWHDLGAVREMPLSLGGTATHNIENILGASLLAATLDISVPAIRETLHRFGNSASDNPGRLQLYRFGGMTAVVDYAHNPDGLAALCATASALAAKRRLLILGQAGDRDDGQLRALVDAAWSITHFDRVIIKEMERMLRGRALGEVTAVLADELSRLGALNERVEVAPSEFDAIKRAFGWARDGDVLVCPVHSDKQLILEWLAQLRAAKWTPGAALPV